MYRHFCSFRTLANENKSARCLVLRGVARRSRPGFPDGSCGPSRGTGGGDHELALETYWPLGNTTRLEMHLHVRCRVLTDFICPLPSLTPSCSTELPSIKYYY